MEKYKTNPLTLKPGGYNLTFIYSDKTRTNHYNVKSVAAYGRTMQKSKSLPIIACNLHNNDSIYVDCNDNFNIKPIAATPAPMPKSNPSLQAAIGRVNRQPDSHIDIKFIDEFDLDLSKISKLKDDRMQFHQWE